jgi:hypothetical protein
MPRGLLAWCCGAQVPVLNVCILYNQRYTTCTMFFIIISAVHVSGGFSAHHQEPIKCMCSLGYCHAFWYAGAYAPTYQKHMLLHTRQSAIQKQFQLIHTSGRQQESMTISKAAHTFYKLLMMGGKTARNMYSADNNKEHCISCISLVI